MTKAKLKNKKIKVLSDKEVMMIKYIKPDKFGKYYLIDSEKFIVEGFEGISRSEMYAKLARIKAIDERTIYQSGMDCFLRYVNRLLDGTFYIGRFKVYRVSKFTESLENQMNDESLKHIREA